MAAELSGGVFIGNEPELNQEENVTIAMLNNPIEYVQQAILNVNIHAWGRDELNPDHARMKVLVDLLIPLLDNQTYNINGTTIHVDILNDNGVYPNQENIGKFYYNFRINCITL